jgi:hypothetical protein
MSQFKLLLFVLLGMTSLTIQAQPYPNKPIKLIVVLHQAVRQTMLLVISAYPWVRP